jgi:lysophospholipase L1-like esterase
MLNENGEPNPDLFLDDGLHLNEQGYQLWDKVLAPFFETN